MNELSFALRRQQRGLVIWALSLAAYSLMIVSMWPTIHRSAKPMQDYMSSWPKGLRDAFGITDMTTPTGYLGAELFSVILPLLVIVAAINITLELTAGYEDAGYFETLLVLPVTRDRILLTRGLAALVALAGLGGVLYLALAGGGLAVDMHLSQGRLAAATLTVIMLAMLHAAIGYLGAGLGLGRGAALGLAAGVAVLGYAVNNLFPLVTALRGTAKYSPWHWTIGQDPLRTGLPVGGILLTLAVTAMLVTVGTIAFIRRDIRVA
jgi:ABC-2 type transport system permease protein